MMVRHWISCTVSPALVFLLALAPVAGAQESSTSEAGPATSPAPALDGPVKAAPGAREDFRGAFAAGLDALNSERFEDAVEAFTRARELDPASAAALYNLGLAQYRLGRFEEAAKQFEETMTHADADLANRALFNLGNAAYAEALQQLLDPTAGGGGTAPPSPVDVSGAADDEGHVPNPMQRAQERLQQALDRFLDAAIADPTDLDARRNAELAHRLIRSLEQQSQNQQSRNQQSQDQQSQDQQSQDQQSQDQQSQDQQSQDQQSQGQQSQDQQSQDQQSQDQQSQDQQSQDQQSQDQQSQDQQSRDQQSQDQQSQDQQSQDQQSRDQQSQDQQSKDQQSQDQQSQDQQSQDQQSQEQQSQDQEQSDQGDARESAGAAGADGAESRPPMTREEAERLLQGVRDRERARRAEQSRDERSRRRSGGKDW